MDDHSAQELLWLAWIYDEHKHDREANELGAAIRQLKSMSDEKRYSKREQNKTKRQAS
jgi:hypothetical protein